jgi:hypothetical protein
MTTTGRTLPISGSTAPRKSQTSTIPAFGWKVIGIDRKACLRRQTWDTHEDDVLKQ